MPETINMFRNFKKVLVVYVLLRLTPSFTDSAKSQPLCASFTDTYLVLAIARGFTKGVSVGVI